MVKLETRTCMIVLAFITLFAAFFPLANSEESELFLSVQTDKPFYLSGELVRIFGTVQNHDGTPIGDATIGIEVKNPGDNTIFLDIVYSQSDGTYEDSFRLPSASTSGQYRVFATAHKTGYPTVDKQTLFWVTIPGDVNCDGTVDIFDVGVISAHWYPGPPIGVLGYNATADINEDGAVDIFDIGIVSANWGESW